MFLDLSLHHTVRSSYATRAEQNSPTCMSQSLSMRLTKSVSADPQMWCFLSETHFLTRLRRRFLITRLTMF